MAGASKWEFTEDEIRGKLEELGYYNLPDNALKEFSNDLHKMIAEESSEDSHHITRVRDLSSSSVTSSTLSSPANTTTSSELSEYTPDYGTRHEAAAPRNRVTFKQNADKIKQNPPSFSDSDEPRASHSPFFRSNTRQYIAPEKENKTTVNIHDTSLRLAQKRKVLRHKDGITRVFDESFTNDTSGTDISDMEERLQNLPLKDKARDNSHGSVCSDQSEDSAVWSTGMNRNALPSFIRPKSSDLSSRGMRKTDPVNRYHQFNKQWRSKKVPGEKTHKNLRWSTREQMLQYETFEKPRHNYIPNKYVAPTEKKRQALRWEVRSTLANT